MKTIAVFVTQQQKLAVIGVAIVAASGDNGAPGAMYPYCARNNEDPNFHLSSGFPSSSQFATAVGAALDLAV